MATKQVSWKAVDQPVAGLATNALNSVQVQREAIPIIFIPGVMGSRLRLAGTGATPDAKTAGLPNIRWDPGSKKSMLGNYLRASPAERKALLIGPGNAFNPIYLEVANDNPPGNGYRGLLEEYVPFLERLRGNDWGALGKLFVFPVYAFGYNWSASNRLAGAKLAQRIGEIIDESKKVSGLCEKVILVTHSMGGLVARSAMKLFGAEGRVLGVVHGVQPVYGAVAAYTRIKGGFEGGFFDPMSRCLGPTGRDVTALLANSVGGLQLLPGRQYRTSKAAPEWLRIPDQPSGWHLLPLRNDPFNEIYRVPAVVAPDAGSGATHNNYWGLVDPALLTPEVVAVKPKPGSLDEELAGARSSDLGWKGYLANLAEAESLLADLGTYHHGRTWWFNGDGLDTPETASYELSSNWVRSENYPKDGFRGLLRDPKGSNLQAVLQGPDGKGDGTVPRMSSSFNGSTAPSPAPPSNKSFDKLAHQPAYANAAAQAWTIQAVTAIAGLYFKDHHG